MNATPAPRPSRDRALGALMGVHAGDCLGSGFEFQSWSSIRSSNRLDVNKPDLVGGGSFRWKPGQPTDDTDLTRAVLLGYLDRHRRHASSPEEEFDVATAAGRRMLDWVSGIWPNRKKGTPPVDIGGATAQGLSSFAEAGETVVDERPTGAGEDSAGNGSLMRCIPSAIFEDRLDVALRNARRIGAITHTSSACVGAVSAYIAIAWSLVRGVSVHDALSIGLAIAASFPVVYNAMRQAMDRETWNLHMIAEKGPTRETLPKLASGWVIESLKLAVAAVLDTRSVEEVLVDVVRVGKDTDTNAAIAGGLLGAREGVDGIPWRWRDKCWFKGEFEEVVDEILGGRER